MLIKSLKDTLYLVTHYALAELRKNNTGGVMVYQIHGSVCTLVLGTQVGMFLVQQKNKNARN